LFSVGSSQGLQFGGVGLMVQQPRTEISATPSPRLEISGLETTAVRSAVDRWFASLSYLTQHPILSGKRISADLPIRLTLTSCPPRHQGLGTGTQIAFATALALHCALELPIPPIAEFAARLNRGKRSAIGSYGFFQGGLLLDRGKLANEILSPLDFRAEFPSSWPVLILLDRCECESAVFGDKEVTAFEELSETPDEVRQSMVKLARDEMLTGLVQGDYQRFANAVFQLGHQSGSFFEPVQLGPYHSPAVAELVEFIRNTPTQAVGQSSWGPAVFAISETAEDAESLVGLIRYRYPNRYHIIQTLADNSGVVVK
jgi:beta-RFAP synthase